MEQGKGHLRDIYLKEKDVETYLIVCRVYDDINLIQLPEEKVLYTLYYFFLFLRTLFGIIATKGFLCIIVLNFQYKKCKCNTCVEMYG